MESNFGEKGEQLFQQAEKTLKGGFFKNLMSQKQDRVDEAKELYGQAANCFKLCAMWAKAAECYRKCIECEEQEGDRASCYLDLANCLKNQGKTQDYLAYSRKAIDAYCLQKRLSQAASLAKEIGELLEESFDYEGAVAMFERAAEFYALDNTPTHGNQLLVRASDLRILSRDYDRGIPIAIKNYDKVGRKYLSQAMIKSNAKDLFFKVVLCHLANDDLIGAKRQISTYQLDDPNFDNSRE